MNGLTIYLNLRSLLNVVESAFSSADTLTTHVRLYSLYSERTHTHTKKKNQNKYEKRTKRLKRTIHTCFILKRVNCMLYSPMLPCNYHNFSLCLHFLSLNLHLTDYNRIELKSDYQCSNCTCNTTMEILSVLDWLKWFYEERK